MAPFPFKAVSTVLAASFTVTSLVNAQLPKTGNITLFSDSSCGDPVYVNSWILGRDVCGIADNSAFSPTDTVFQSYILNARPWCKDGSRPYFNVYSDQACSSLINSYEPGPLYNPSGPDSDGTCVAPGTYKAMAFVCEGIPGAATGERVSGSVGGGSTQVLSTDGSTFSTSSATSASSTVEVTSSATSASSTAEVTSMSPTPNATSMDTKATASPSNGTMTDTNQASTSAFEGAGAVLQYSYGSVVLFMVPMVLLSA